MERMQLLPGCGDRHVNHFKKKRKGRRSNKLIMVIGAIKLIVMRSSVWLMLGAIGAGLECSQWKVDA